MKGATAEPDVKTIKLPNRTTQMMMGRSQNFFRSLMNDQSSIRNSPIIASELLIHTTKNAKVTEKVES
jgi:hypothetical protein